MLLVGGCVQRRIVHGPPTPQTYAVATVAVEAVGADLAIRNPGHSLSRIARARQHMTSAHRKGQPGESEKGATGRWANEDIYIDDAMR